jgi:proteasome alpha subunit
VFGISGAGYDQSTGIFSPEGRIFAAEYAKKAVEQGATSIGILCKEGVVLLAEKRVMPLQEPDSIEKISMIDTHIGVATSGFMADARRLIQTARYFAQNYWLRYEEPIPAEALADDICDLKARFTQGGGARPFGVAMIIASVDSDGTPRLFTTDPVGTYWGYLAAVIGRGTNKAGEYLSKHYKQNITLKQAITLALETLQETSESELTADIVEIAQIPIKTGTFYKFKDTEIQSLLAPKSPKQ